MTDQPTKTRPGDQPLPTAGHECVQDALIALIEERKQLGIQRYGSPLMTHNGRDAGRDAVEEALDLTVYSMQVAMELRDLRAAVAELAQAIRLTREYVGEELLPPVEGWSWYDALRRHAPHELPALAPSAPAATQATKADDSELTADEARALVDELSTDLYRAQDALAFVEECCVIADREQRAITTADVREWLKGARCGRQLAAGAPAAAEATEPHTGLVVQPYAENGEQKWVFRCWGTDTCDGWLSLDHYSEQSATRARDRHIAEEHTS